MRPAADQEEVITSLRARGITLTWDEDAGTLRPGSAEAVKTITGKAS